MGASAIAVAAFMTVPVGDDSALQWLVDLCLPGDAPAPDIEPIAMEHKTHFATKAAVALSIVSGALIFLGLRQDDADPDKQLAAMAFMANATPGISQAALRNAVARETGFGLSEADAIDALACYKGIPSTAELTWLAEGASKNERRALLKAALGIGWNDGGFSKSGLGTLSAFAHAFELSGDELAALLPKTSQDPSYDAFPAIDSVSHWIARAARPFLNQSTKHSIGAFS